MHRAVRTLARRCGPASLPLHIKGPADVTPGIALSEYQARRQALGSFLTPNALAVVPANAVRYMAHEVPFRFRQSTDFSYLTGFPESDAVLVLHTQQTASHVDATLFMRPHSPSDELWNGPRITPAQAERDYGVTRALSMGDLKPFLIETLKEKEALYFTPIDGNPEATRIVNEAVVSSSYQGVQRCGGSAVQALRIIKSDAEISIMEKSCQIASHSLIDSMRTARAGMLEADLDATMEYQCRLRGARFLAYPSVVAGGPRALTIHYLENSHALAYGDLVLMDAGCDYLGYSSDITRTFPVSGKYSPAQKVLYELVLELQRQCIALCVPNGTRALRDIHEKSIEIAAQLLIEAGILPSTWSQATINTLLRLYPHAIGHHLGMDVHDVQECGLFSVLQPRMVVTMEPGIYVPDSPEFPKEFRGIGIRIEDDVLIQSDGPRVLTHECPKTVAEIEELMATR
eukprot:m.125197 g.125197  ORF g.125197 m.125197 type:complete len:459 (-) comp9370_c0_seq4:693-2069(-)